MMDSADPRNSKPGPWWTPFEAGAQWIELGKAQNVGAAQLSMRLTEPAVPVRSGQDELTKN